MGPQGDAGGVCFLEDIEHPVKVARAVMEETPHVLLAGDGARDFALAQGLNLGICSLPRVKRLGGLEKSAEYKPIINVENHDTIGMIAQDLDGNLAGACTTSGLAYKLRGRVGDSPIIGAGLFVDNEIGACTATGLGEAVMKTLGSFLVVELIRQGRSPQQACEEAVDRIMRKMPVKDLQVGYLAMDTKGRSGSFAIHKGFNYARTIAGQTEMIDAAYRSLIPMAITSLSSKRSNLLGVLALSRPRNLAIAAVTLLLIRYGWMTRWNTGGASLQTSVFQIFEATLVMVLLMAAGNIINAYFDVQEDRINRPQRAIVDRTVKRRVLIFTHQVLNLLGLLIALHLSWGLGSLGPLVLATMVSWILWRYSASWKSIPLLGNASIALLLGLVPLWLASLEYPGAPPELQWICSKTWAHTASWPWPLAW